MDNYDTRHALAKTLAKAVDKKARITGTVKLTNVDAIYTKNIQEACLQLKNAKRGSWKLAAMYDPPPNVSKQC